MKTRLDKLRIGWLRWLGQKMRCDKHYWITLYGSNWIGWASSVLEKHDSYARTIKPTISDGRNIGHYFEEAIRSADMKDLIRLDRIFCTDLIEKRGW